VVSALAELSFELPCVRPLERPMAYNGTQLHRLIAAGNTRPDRCSPSLQRIVRRVEELRGTSATWAFGLALGDLITWSVRMARGSVASLAAPLTFFKIDRYHWVPKVMIRVYPNMAAINPDELHAYHTTCRRASIEFMSITEEHIVDGYIESKHFKRAFNGAFFCDRLQNTTIFCPTLREWGFFKWEDDEAHFAASAR